MDVRTLCLGVLTLGEASGYDIKKQFEEGPFAHFHQAGFGSIYPALDKLRSEGLVTCRELSQRGRPDKKVYSITAKGMEAFCQKLSNNPAPDKLRSETMVMFFFAHLMDQGHLRHVFDEYLSAYRRHIEHLKSLDPKGIAPGRRFARGFGRAFYEAAVKYMEENRHILFEDEAKEEPKTGTGR